MTSKNNKLNLLVIINIKFNANRRAEFIKLFLDSYNIYIVCPENKNIPNINGCNYIYTKYLMGTNSNIVQDLKFLKELYKINKYIKPKVILSFTVKPFVYSAFTFKNSKKIGTLTGLGYAFEKNNLKTFIARILIKIAAAKYDKVIVQNNYDLQIINKYTFKSIKVDGSGIDLNNFKNVDLSKKRTKNLLMVGRLIYAKGYEHLLNNLNELDEFLIKKNLILNIVGELDYSNPDSLNVSEINQIKNTKNINLIFGTENIDQFYNNSDILLLTSNREGFCRVNVEAMYYGLSIITLRNPGCYEMLPQNNKINYMLDEFNLELIKDHVLNFYNISEFDLLNSRKANNEYVLSKLTSKSIYNEYLKILK